MRPIILFLDRGKCCICESASYKNHVHHIDMNSSNNDAHNLVTICKQHHELAHKTQMEIRIGEDFIPYIERESLNELVTKLF